MINDQIISSIRFLCVHPLFFLHYHVLNKLNISIIADVVYLSPFNSFLHSYLALLKYLNIPVFCIYVWMWLRNIQVNFPSPLLF